MSGYFRAYSNRVREATRDLEERELRVWLALLSFANCDGLAWPGYKTLCDLTGVCNDAVRDVLLSLAGKGYIEVVRKGARDPLTGQQWSNVYNIDGAVTDDPNCIDDESELPSLALSSNEDSYHHQSTQPKNTTKETQPKTPPPPTTDSFEVEEAMPKQKRNAKTPKRSLIPENPPQLPAAPPRFYRGPLADFAQELALDQEQAAVAIYNQLEHKLTKRLARYLVATYGKKRVDWALAHMSKQTDVFNPPGYVRALLERQAIEEADAAAVSPGAAYITGAFADYIDH